MDRFDDPGWTIDSIPRFTVHAATTIADDAEMRKKWKLIN